MTRFVAPSSAICSISCIANNECGAAIFDKEKLECTLHKTAMADEVESSPPNGMVYLVTISARDAVSKLYLGVHSMSS